MTKTTTLAAIIASTFVLTTGALADQPCRDVRLKITNDFGVPITVTKVNYRDKEDAKWRDNNLHNTEIPTGRSRTIEEKLEYVGNEHVPKMQVQFRYREKDGDWSDRQWSNVTSDLGGSECVRHKVYRLMVADVAPKR